MKPFMRKGEDPRHICSGGHAASPEGKGSLSLFRE